MLHFLFASSAAATTPLASAPLGSAAVAARAEAALLGSFILDAAAMPFHWEYSQSTIAAKVGSGNPEYFSPPMDLWYKGKTGMSTPYGQQGLAYLAVGANASAGLFDPRAVEAAYWALCKFGARPRQKQTRTLN